MNNPTWENATKQIECSTQSSVRQWRTISYGYLVTRRNFELRLPFSIDIHSTDAHGDLPTRQRKAAALQKTG
jgi:hypothetical protein